jgi:serine/threonine protein kinase
MPLPRALSIAGQVAGAVAAAHKQSVVHRDLKPANIMVGAQDRVKVLDFGLAKLRQDAQHEAQTALPSSDITADGHVVGTVAYMSPEQAEGRKIDERSDIFSFGVVLYELITGRRPFRATPAFRC